MNNKKHLVFIINPKSGTDRVKGLQAVLEAHLDLEKYTYDVQRTRHPRHGTELARAAAAAQAYGVIAVGGDGSVNDVVAGLAGTDTALGIIPGGSGNGIARTFGIPLKYEGAVAVLNRDHTAPVDIAFANGRPFISNAGVGFDVLISKKFEKSTRRGILGYSWLVLRHLWSYKELEWRITINGQKVRERAFLVNVANGQQFGYNFKIAPDASYNDGLLDVVVIKKFPKLYGCSMVWRAMTGNITKSAYVHHYRTQELTIAHPKLDMMQTDGDAHICTNSIDFRVASGGISVFLP